MRQAVTQAKKARRYVPAPHWDVLYNAPVWLRRKKGFMGADHLAYSVKHGIISQSVSPVSPADPGVAAANTNRVSWIWNLIQQIRDFLKRLFGTKTNPES